MARIRADVPALAGGTAFFDSPGGTQTPRPVIEAIAATLSAPLANRGHDNAAQRNAEGTVARARAALGDLTAADPAGVVFGRSATQLTFDFARVLARTWQPDEEVVLTRLDHDANVRPWVLAAQAVGARVRWADFDPASGELTLDHIRPLIGERTRLLAVTGASNLIGTLPDVPVLAAEAHAVEALVWVDAVHLAAHRLLDLPSSGADFLVCSPYKFLGPHHAAVVAAPVLLETLRPDKLLPATETVPERFELGTLPYELLAGTAAAVDYLAALVPGRGDRRQRLAASYAAMERHETKLLERLEGGLAGVGAQIYSRSRRRTSTVLFDLPGHSAPAVARHLAAADINAPAGCFYAVETSRHLGLGDGGAVRVGLAPYSNLEDVDRLLAAVERLGRRES